jgi:hypothetical protein
MAGTYIPSGKPVVDPRTGAVDIEWLRFFSTVDDRISSVAWGSINFAGSSLGDLVLRSASDLNAGTVPLARLSGITNTQIAAGANIDWLKINKAGSQLSDLGGLLPDARLPGYHSNGVARVQGLSFDPTPVPSSDKTTLDDYREDDWTPGLSAASGSGFTFSQQIGNYIKVGKLVVCSFALTLTAVGTASGQLTLTTLPFTVENAGSSALWNNMGGLWSSAVAFTGITFFPIVNTTTALVGAMTGASTSSFGGMTVAQLGAAGILRATFAYRANA